VQKESGSFVAGQGQVPETCRVMARKGC